MHLDRKLMAYAAGAAAAGFAGAQSADAAIVTRPGFNFGSGSTTNINFDNSGNEEYVLGHRADPNRVALLKDDQTLDSNAYVADGGVPAALQAGDIISADSLFANSYDAELANVGGTGNFNVDNITGNPDYLGVKFQLTDGGPTYFGWVGVDITNENTLAGRVTGFAYETSGESIAAGAVPEPVGLALLALGAPFLLMRRRTA